MKCCVVTDNGGNFVRANALQGKLWEILRGEKDTLEQKKPDIKWRFNTPYASHRGGVFERMVGATKQALYHVLPDTLGLTLEQYITALALVEGTLNSRPLTYVSSDPADLAPITPNHFLYGAASRPVYQVKEGTGGAEKRWLQVQEIADLYWQQLQKTILPALRQLHPQRLGMERDYQVGDVVTFLHPTRRAKWPLARVTRVFPGRDGRIRTVELELAEAALESKESNDRRRFVRDVGRVALLLPDEGGD